MTTVDTPGSWQTLRRGLSLSPELRTGVAGIVGLAVVAMVGRVAIPIAVQQIIDHGLPANAAPRMGFIAAVVLATLVVLGLTSTCTYLMMRRLFTVSETALASVRTRTFRHIHDLSMLHQQSERRGALTSRVTSDIDQITQFIQWGGVVLFISLGQVVVTTLVMLVYSWQLTLVVFASFLPLVIVVRVYQRRLASAYGQVRTRIGTMLAAISESVVGAEVIRSYGVSGRTEARLGDAIDAHRRAQLFALRTSVTSFSSGELVAGIATAAVVVAGVMLGVGGHLDIGELTAFLFLVALFVQPIQVSTEVINEAQNAVAGWRRVLEVLDLRPDVADPAAAGRDLPSGPIDVRFRSVGFAYPATDGAGELGPEVLSDVDVAVAARSRVAVVGETGSGKTTFAKLLTRLMDPTRGSVLLAGEPLTGVRFSSLRRRVVLVPQDGFLFDASIAENVRFGRPELTDGQVAAAFTELGLADWVDGLPRGLDTAVGERGEALSVGERQLVSLVRAYVADPDLLVLDEATSAVDPATEVRLQRTLDAVTRGRTTIAIAHRLSTAESADEVIVFDGGRVVQRGAHASLVAESGSVYGRLHAAWQEQTRA
jgi:ABC-type multidrug transport system fused ATPase/permease subunit